MEYPKTFTVTRSKWVRGRPFESALLTEEGTMCCLGFVAEQCGVSRKELLGATYPYKLRRSAPPLLAYNYESNTPHGVVTLWRDSELSGTAAQINDSHGLTDSEREEKLILWFENHGLELIFVD